MARSNEKTEATSSATGGPDSPTRPRSRAKAKRRNKTGAKDKGKGIAKTSSAMIPGPSNTNNNASSSRTSLPNPEIGPARRHPPIPTSSPGPSRPSTTTQGGNAPVADMGCTLSLERKGSTRPTSRTVTAHGEGSSTELGRLRSSNASRENVAGIWDFGNENDDFDDPAVGKIPGMDPL